MESKVSVWFLDLQSDWSLGCLEHVFALTFEFSGKHILL